MSRLSKEELSRFSGAAWLLEYAKEHGLEEAEKEVERRGIRQMPLKLKDSDVDVFVQSERQNVLNCLLINTIAVLSDEFGFKDYECKRFVDRFNLKTACIVEGYVNWKELRDTVQKELGIEIALCEALENEDER